MPWIDRIEIERVPKAARPQPTRVVAKVKVFEAADAGQAPIIQIDTFGSGDREHPGKLSQTLQLGPETAAALCSLLQDTYGFK